MSGYRIFFFKNLVNSDGHRFKCLQNEIVVPHADTPAEALDCAARVFALQHGGGDWRIFADVAEVEPSMGDVTPARVEVRSPAARAA